MSHLALVLPSKQGEWEVGSWPTPKPAPGEILVKVYSAGLNPVDAIIQKSGLFVQQYPAIIGWDGSGVVESVGEGVTTFVKGDRILHQGTVSQKSEMATFQQYAIVPAQFAARIPESISFDEAATIPLTLATAAVGLYLPLGEAWKITNPDGNAGIGLTPPWTPEGKGKYTGQSIVVLGGSSSVGQFAIQLARLSGFSPIIATSSLTHQEFLKGIGATHVVDRNGDQVTEIKKFLKGGEADVVYDAIGTEECQQLAVAVSSPKASIVLVKEPATGVDFGKRLYVKTFGSAQHQQKLGAALYSALPKLLEDGSLKPNRTDILPGGLKGIPDGLERLLANKVSGVKLVAHPWD